MPDKIFEMIYDAKTNKITTTAFNIFKPDDEFKKNAADVIKSMTMMNILYPVEHNITEDDFLNVKFENGPRPFNKINLAHISKISDDKYVGYFYTENQSKFIAEIEKFMNTEKRIIDSNICEQQKKSDDMTKKINDLRKTNIKSDTESLYEFMYLDNAIISVTELHITRNYPKEYMTKSYQNGVYSTRSISKNNIGVLRSKTDMSMMILEENNKSKFINALIDHLRSEIDDKTTEIEELEHKLSENSDKTKIPPTSKEVHFWFNDNYPEKETIHGYTETQNALNNDTDCVHTTQVILCQTNLYETRRIFIHPRIGETFEIKIGNNEPYTHREIRTGHNLTKLLLSGEFDSDKITVR